MVYATSNHLIELPGMLNVGYASVSSARYREAEQECAWPTVVLRLRFNGIYLPCGLLSSRPRVVCRLLSRRDGVIEVRDADPAVKPPIPGLWAAKVLKRREDGSYLIEGNEWDEAQIRSWPQTWLCCASAEAVDAALEPMKEWLSKEYERARAQFQARK